MYIVGFKHNGNGIDWLRDPIHAVSYSHIKDAESDAGPECDAVIRQQGILQYRGGKVPTLINYEVRIRFIRCR